MKIAFVVLTYNRSDALLAVLRALARQCGPQHEVVIADDGSREEHVLALRAGLPAFNCPVRHVWIPDVGFTAARSRNLGAAHSRADYLVFLDGDCVPALRFVQMHLRLAQANHFVNGSRVLLSQRLTERVVSRQVELADIGPAGWLRLRARGDVNKLTHLFPWPGAPGRVEERFRWKGIRSCNFAVWRRDFEAVDGFDQSFSGWGHEDADLVLRLHHQGLRRKNGFLATEVFHLWHRENARDQESPNRVRVQARAGSGIIRAEAGLSTALHAGDTVVTELNR
jgi:GT2 family glycosyltransferase